MLCESRLLRHQRCTTRKYVCVMLFDSLCKCSEFSICFEVGVHLPF